MSRRARERDTAGLTAKGLDALGAAMLAIPDESMDGGVCDPLGRTVIGPTQGTQRRQREDEQKHEQKHGYIHEAFSLPEIRRRAVSF
ncbi:MAG TPA: hypothetical protein VF043_02910 [Ktedonobacteraceae bacterium]